jgi:hypothetical protein
MCQQPICYPTMPEEVHCLRNVMRWHELPEDYIYTTYDPCVGTGMLTATMKSMLTDVAMHYVTNDIHTAYSTNFNRDATLIETWRDLPPIDFVATSAPFELLDIYHAYEYKLCTHS